MSKLSLNPGRTSRTLGNATSAMPEKTLEAIEQLKEGNASNLCFRVISDE